MNIIERLRRFRDENIPKPWIIPTHVFEAGIEVRNLNKKYTETEFVFGNDGSMNPKGYRIYLDNCYKVCVKCNYCRVTSDETRQVKSLTGGNVIEEIKERITPCAEYLPQIIYLPETKKPFSTGVTVKDSSGGGFKVEIILHNTGYDSDYLRVCREICNGDDCDFKRVEVCTGIDDKGKAEAYSKKENTKNALQKELKPPCMKNSVRFSHKTRSNNSRSTNYP